MGKEVNTVAFSPPPDGTLDVLLQWGFLVFGAVFILMFLVKILLNFWGED